MDAAIINPFLNAALSLFKGMFEVTAVPGQAYLLAEQINHRWEISGILGVTGDYHGIVAFRLPKLLADKLLEKSGVSTNNEQERLEMVNAMVGELTNIISGNASADLSDASIEISPPVVVLGANHQIAWPKIAPVIGMPFATPYGPFEIDVCFKGKK